MKPKILQLALEDSLDKWLENFGDLVEAIKPKAELESATTPDEFLKYCRIESNRPKAVLVIGTALINHDYPQVLVRLYQYAQVGGMVILIGNFTGPVKDDKLSDFFNAFYMSWKPGNYTKDDVYLNSRSQAKIDKSCLEEKYNLQALWLRDVRVEDAVYLKCEEHDLQGLHGIMLDAQTPMAIDNIGPAGGGLVYIGDVSPSKGTIKAVLAICGI